MIETFGKITISGTAGEIANTKLAFTEGTPVAPLPGPLQTLSRTPYRIEYHSAAEFKDKGYFTPGTRRAAWGYFPAKRVQWINSNAAARFPKKIRHAIRHEFGHNADDDYLDAPKRRALMGECLVDPGGHHPSRWNVRKVYEDANEGFADGFAEAVSGVEGTFYEYDVTVPQNKLARLIAIVFGTPQEPVPEPAPQPGPMPPAEDPCAAQIAQLTGERDRANDERNQARVALATAEARLLAKDNFMREGLNA